MTLRFAFCLTTAYHKVFCHNRIICHCLCFHAPLVSLLCVLRKENNTFSALVNHFV